MTFRNSSDDTQIDGCIMVGFKVGYDFADTACIRAGRLWSECYSLPNTIGMKFSNSVENIFINDAQIWGCEKPILMDLVNGNRIAFDRIIVINPLAAPLVVHGGNISFNTLSCRGLPNGISAITYVDKGDGRATVSHVSGLLIDESSGGTSPVIACNGLNTNYLKDLHIVAPYRPAGTAAIVGTYCFGPSFEAGNYRRATATMFSSMNNKMLPAAGVTATTTTETNLKPDDAE